MNADNKYKSAIDGVSFSPDFEINLKRRLRGETLIKMEPTRQSPLRVITLAGMSIAACFLCFFAVKIASERLDSALVSEPAVTSIETEYTTYFDETSPAAGTRPGAQMYDIPAPAGGESERASVSDEAEEDAGVFTYYVSPDSRIVADDAAADEGKTYRPAVALEGLLAAFDEGSFAVFAEKGVTAFASETTESQDTVETGIFGEGMAGSGESANNSVTVTTVDYSLEKQVRTYLESVIESGNKNSFSEYKTGIEQYRIDINGSDGTLLYSIWAFDNCVLVERFAPDGLMKCYIEVSE
jgi:hypothetical protein